MNDVLQKSKLVAPEVTLERGVPYPPEQVFKAWTDQEALRQWMGPGKICAPNATMDARVGGAYAFPMQRPDGTVTTVRGVIKELVPNRKLRFTWTWGEEDGTGEDVTEVTLSSIRPRPARGLPCATPASPIRTPATSTPMAGAAAPTRSSSIWPANSRPADSVTGLAGGAGAPRRR
jgi:uncharacterized protein YndB with AHSA1/START domain